MEGESYHVGMSVWGMDLSVVLARRPEIDGYRGELLEGGGFAASSRCLGHPKQTELMLRQAQDSGLQLGNPMRDEMAVEYRYN